MNYYTPPGGVLIQKSKDVLIQKSKDVLLKELENHEYKRHNFTSSIKKYASSVV